MRAKIFLLSVILGIVLSACGGQEMQISDAWARPGLAANNSAVFFTIDNPTNDNEKLLGVSCDAAQKAEIHRSFLQNDVMKMERQEFVDIPPGSQVTFEPGGYHVMLIGLKADLSAGERVNLELEFEQSGDVRLSVEVQER